MLGTSTLPADIKLNLSTITRSVGVVTHTLTHQSKKMFGRAVVVKLYMDAANGVPYFFSRDDDIFFTRTFVRAFAYVQAGKGWPTLRQQEQGSCLVAATNIQLHKDVPTRPDQDRRRSLSGLNFYRKWPRPRTNMPLSC